MNRAIYGQFSLLAVLLSLGISAAPPSTSAQAAAPGEGAASMSPATSAWYPWAFELDDPALKEIDLSFLLEAPAGKHGFLGVGKDGHLHFQDGTPARLNALTRFLHGRLADA